MSRSYSHADLAKEFELAEDPDYLDKLKQTKIPWLEMTLAEVTAMVAKDTLDNAFSKPVDALTESEGLKIHDDIMHVTSCVVYRLLDMRALIRLYEGTDITCGSELYGKMEQCRIGIEGRFWPSDSDDDIVAPDDGGGK
jgi:hypothetical protein